MKNNSNRKISTILLSILSLLLCFSLAACTFTVERNTSGSDTPAAVISNESGTSSSSDGEKTVVSYVSTSSSVFSSTAEVVKAVADSVVEISTESVTTQWGRQYIVSGAGSGVIIGKSGTTYYVVTNNHVIDSAREITLATRSGVKYAATLVATDDSADIAVVTVNTTDELSIAVWGNSDELQIGEDLIAIGNPLGSLGGTVTKGILSATGRTISIGNYAMTLLQTDTAINPGNSGGGLFNMRGELIGVVNAKTTDEEIEGICFAIPANTARRVVSDLIEHGYVVGRAAFPVSVAESSLSSGILSSSQTIVYVTQVNAEGTQFKKYDMIYSVNGKRITSLLDYNTALASVSAGDSVSVVVYRGSVSKSFWSSDITFASEPTSFTVKALQYGA